MQFSVISRIMYEQFERLQETLITPPHAMTFECGENRMELWCKQAMRVSDAKNW